MADDYTKEHEKAEKIIRTYKWSHAGTAIVAGALGGQFGFDRIPLTMLTISMINLYMMYQGIIGKSCKDR